VRVLLFVVLGLAVLGGVGSIVDLFTRPPCPERYVRLIDFEAAVPFACAFFGLLAGGLLLVIRTLHKQQRPTSLWIAVLAVAILLPTTLLAGIGVVSNTDNNQPYDNSCWTF
jgi:hypothetical protein